MNTENTNHVDAIARERIGSLKELVESRFVLEQKARELVAAESLAHFDRLNHARQEAVKKEQDFLPRERYEVFVQRTADDFETLRKDISATANGVTAARQAAAEALAATIAEQNKANDQRFGRLEASASRLQGALVLASFLIPIATGFVVWALSRLP